MGSIGAARQLRELTEKRLASYDPRFSTDIQEAGKFFEQYPGVDGVMNIWVDRNMDANTVAYMNGAGMLAINPRLANDYDGAIREVNRLMNIGYLSGKGGDFRSVIAHEMAHNFDLRFATFASSKAPEGEAKPESVGSDIRSEMLSYAFNRKVGVDETVSIPTYDSKTEFISFGGRKYSMDSLPDRVSDIIVPQAISNIRSNWKELGFQHEPTDHDLTYGLSTYAGRSYTRGGRDAKTEVFAESISNYAAYGKSANPLSQEVVRLTNDLYKQLKKRKTNASSKHWDRVNHWVSKNLEKKLKEGKL